MIRLAAAFGLILGLAACQTSETVARALQPLSAEKQSVVNDAYANKGSGEVFLLLRFARGLAAGCSEYEVDQTFHAAMRGKINRSVFQSRDALGQQMIEVNAAYEKKYGGRALDTDASVCHVARQEVREGTFVGMALNAV